MEQKQIPGLVKALAILGFIGVGIWTLISIFLIIFGIIGTINPPEVTNPYNLPMSDFDKFVGNNMGPIFLGMGILFLALNVFGFFLNRALMNGINWARIFYIISMSISSIFALFKIITGEFAYLLTLLFGVLVISYLAFSKQVKEAFS